jgi:hypothetical protein
VQMKNRGDVGIVGGKQRCHGVTAMPGPFFFSSFLLFLFELWAAAGEFVPAICVPIAAGKGERLQDASQHIWLLCPQPPQLGRRSLVWDERVPALHPGALRRHAVRLD